MQFLSRLESVFDVIVQYGILFFEVVGVCVLIYSALTSVVALFKREPHVRVHLAEGISLALLFKVGSEVLRTLIVREWNELAILGAIVLLRAILTFFIEWEIKNAGKHELERASARDKAGAAK